MFRLYFFKKCSKFGKNFTVLCKKRRFFCIFIPLAAHNFPLFSGLRVGAHRHPCAPCNIKTAIQVPDFALFGGVFGGYTNFFAKKWTNAKKLFKNPLTNPFAWSIMCAREYVPGKAFERMWRKAIGASNIKPASCTFMYWLAFFAFSHKIQHATPPKDPVYPIYINAHRAKEHSVLAVCPEIKHRITPRRAEDLLRQSRAEFLRSLACITGLHAKRTRIFSSFYFFVCKPCKAIIKLKQGMRR